MLSGIKKLPEESFLEPVFHRQIKKARVLQHGLNIYERALDATPERTYRFLYDAAFRYIDRKRTDRNRERIYQSVGGRPNPGAPAPPNKKHVAKGFCISFVRNGSCKKDGCKYKHEIPEERGRPRSKSRASRPPTRENSPSSRPNEPRMCRFFKQGRCSKASTLGDQAQLRPPVQGVASPGVKGVARAVGPSSTDVQADIKVPSLGVTSTPYVLPNIPSVLTVGYRCTEEGFDFIWSLLGGRRSHPFLHHSFRIVKVRHTIKDLRWMSRRTPRSLTTR